MKVSGVESELCESALTLQGVLVSRMKLRFLHTGLGFSLNVPKTEPHGPFLKKKKSFFFSQYTFSN